jgi:hypothetical protein
MENGPFIVDFPTKTSIYEGFSMAFGGSSQIAAVVPPLNPGVGERVGLRSCGMISTCHVMGFNKPSPKATSPIRVDQMLFTLW